MFSVALLYSNGTTSYLVTRGRSSWKTLRSAVRHARDITGIKTREDILKGCLQVWVEDEFGEIVRSFPMTGKEEVNDSTSA